ncbi:dihydrofolate reductase-like domain-containing protein, partial [Thamnocephalis sphaerospora]
RPYVTLTYAQSLDGKIAGRGGQQLRLSGDASMAMTHRMRTLHDGILVGVGTVIHDDPRLAARHLPAHELATPGAIQQPQPIILDTRLRIPLTARLLDPARHAAGDCLPPWIVVGADDGLVDPLKRQQVEERGGRVIPVPTNRHGRLNLTAVMDRLGSLGIRRVMIEGGSQVVRSLLLSHTIAQPLVDLLVVTVAPVLVGEQGV